MNVVLMTILLAGSTLVSVTQVTGRELALLRVILRQSMSMDQHAAYERGDALTKDRISPLELVSNAPNLDELHKIMTSEANDEYRRFNAARAMAFLGDARCTDILAKTLAGEFAASSSCAEQNQAAACLLYLRYGFPKDFLFTRLPNPLYPELSIPDWTRVPFRGLEGNWLGFKKQMRAGDLIYYFTTDDIDWRLFAGAEGYVLIREGKVVDMIVTGIS